MFKEPRGLPPVREFDHDILLQPGKAPMNVRPYRYNHKQKQEIETQVGRMLTESIIRPSHSSYASSVLLVSKKDGTWRFCIDYRELNSITVKDKFPIPLIDDFVSGA